MPPSKRKPRRRQHDREETSEVDLPGSSPTRPATKKRKVGGGRASPNRHDLLRAPLPREDSDDSPGDSEVVSNSDLIDSVISYLQVARDPVVATTEYANEKNQPDTEKVSAYAKIAGREWTYFVVDQVVNIGRPPDNGKDPPSVAASSPLADMKEMLPVHIDLGPSKIISRHHASLFYDSEFPEGGGWHVRVNGRNGVRVNGHLLKRGASQLLSCGDIMEIAGTQMMFVTPGDKAVIDPYFVEKAKQLASGEDWSAAQHAHPDPVQRATRPPGTLYSTTGNHPPLAPAPAGYFKRATTPPVDQKDGRHQRGVFDSRPPPSPLYNRGLVMESTQDIDYSKDAAKDLKPPFSYATMIAQAIFSSEEEKLTLSNIYAWISERYAFYRHSNSGWQNSIRHNLSLNKAFQKVPRRTDEPGKGMKWQIAPEFRQEYWKKQSRKGAPSSSSAPTSPASGAGRDVNSNFRGPNGQILGYDTSMVNSFSAINAAPGAPTVKRDGKYHSFSPSQQLSSDAYTPDRSRQRQDTQTTAPDPDLDESPLPRLALRATPGGLPTYTFSASAQLTHQSPSNPTLSSSYLDTPFPSNHNIITPAPLRQNPRLAPPSTLVAPSKFMPESSPAGPGGLFWKGLMGSTPAHGFPEISPVKREPGDDERGIMSSSPPPMDAGMHSPSKPSRSGAGGGVVKDEATSSNGVGVNLGNEEEEGVGGFDLAKGFQPIGSFHSNQRSYPGNAARVSN